MQDYRMKKNIEHRLSGDENICAEHIGVTVTGQVVTVFGYVQSATEKMAVEDAIREVPGAMGIANEIEIRRPGHFPVADDEIAANALNALRYTNGLLSRGLTVRVQKGHLEINGAVKTYKLKSAATQAVSNLPGVSYVNNYLHVETPLIKPDGVRARLSRAMHEYAENEVQNVRIKVRNSTLILSGDVKSQAEMDSILQAAELQQGVKRVENHLSIRYASPRH